MVKLIGFPQLVKEWPRWRSRVRPEQQRRGIHFLVEWLPTHHPELLTDARSSFYFNTLYPFQDDALRLVSEARTGFYLPVTRLR
jgi:hypothetical protein